MRSDRVLVAPEAFAGSFSAAQVAAAIVRGLEAGGVPADPCPVADGGRGTLSVLLTALGGETRGVHAHDPLGRVRPAGFALLEDGRCAVVEAAEAGGPALVGSPTPATAWSATSRGTGELVAAAIAEGADVVVVAAGGSASIDGGAGAVEAIADAGGLRGARLVVLCDVTTPWEDCAGVAAPAAGADRATVVALGERLDALASRLPRDPRGVPGTGAGGGLAGALWAVHGAVLEPGRPWVLDALGVDARLAEVSAVVVGAGRLDALAGTTASELARRAAAAGVPCHAIVGSLSEDAPRRTGGAMRGDGTRHGPLAGVRVAADLEALEAAGFALARDLA